MSTTCLIPAYNEEPRIRYVISQLLQVPNLDKIIVVNDGSSDNSFHVLTQFPHITLLNHPLNLGKTAAIRTGLANVKTTNVLLFDSDIDFIDPLEVSRSITFFETHASAHMLVYRTVRDKWPQKLVRADLVLSGERLLRTADLKIILHKQVAGFQLEIAINHFFLHHHKNIFWMPFSGLSPNKLHKLGLFHCIIPELNMVYDLFRYRGLLSYFIDLLRFRATQI